jgi:hypothetical protein
VHRHVPATLDETDYWRRAEIDQWSAVHRSSEPDLSTAYVTQNSHANVPFGSTPAAVGRSQPSEYA